MQSPTEHITDRNVKYGVTMMTPAGLQPLDTLRSRRLIVLALNIITYAAMLMAGAHILGAGGWTLVDVILITLFAIGLPWTILGFWNAIIGVALLHLTREPMNAVAPFAEAGNRSSPLALRTAVLMTLRNEDAERAIERLRIVQESVDATGEGASFSYFILSDTSDPDIANDEEMAVARWQSEATPELAARIEYRRREQNTGFKAGNLRDFCERWGGSYDLMLPLDADSLMAGTTIIRMVRMMQAYPRIGILQSLVVGMPSTSAFARIFQFGMRHGMRSYTMGQAWWVGECGPFWGHNAAVRIRPFMEDCELPTLKGGPPFGGPILSHDQYEATLMRRAGYEVRVLPQEGGSWEDNPPTIREFLRRDLRWCQGNMQYLRLLATPGLYPVSRFQLVWAILMFVGIPAWTLMVALLPVATWQAQSIVDFPTSLAIGLYITFFAMYLMPKLAGLLDTLLTTGGVARYGGPLRFFVSALTELVFSFLQGGISTIRTTIFMIGMPFGLRVEWSGQARDNNGMTLASATRALWPQTAFGILVCGALIIIDPSVFYWSLPLTLGYLIAIPFAVATASVTLGNWMKSVGLAGIPEDFNPPWEVRRASGEQPPGGLPLGSHR